MSSIKLPRDIVNQILQHAQSQPDLEICGLISEKNGIVKRVYPILNVSERPDCLFRMDGKEQINAMREMRNNEESLFAIYHSHPHSQAYPSQTDLTEAQYPEANYLIVSLDTEGVLDLRAYRIVNKQIEKLDISI